MEKETNPAETLSKNHLNELLKLKQKKFRKLENRTLAEGMNLLEQLLENGIFPEEIVTDDAELIGRIFRQQNVRILTAKSFELEKLADTETPQQAIGIYKLQEFELKHYKVVLYLDGIQDPGNLGTIFRTAAAFDLDGIVLSPDCCEVFAPKVIRASLGSVFWLPSMTADQDWLAKQRAQKIGLTMQGKTKLNELKTHSEIPLIIVIGSESSGISQEIRNLLTYEAAIPISNKMESLNASVAAGIALYELSGGLRLTRKGE